MSRYADNPLCFVADSGIHGRGLFASVDIPSGTQIGHYDGPKTLDNGTHVLWVEAEPDTDEETVDGWIGYDGTNELRFLNHSRRPNGEMDGQELYACRDIRAGEEITIDYGEEFDATA